MEALIYLVDHDEATTDDLLQFIKGPDFPTGGLVFNDKDIKHACATGRGGVVMRGETEIIETKNGVYQIVITSIPYQVNKASPFIEELMIKMPMLKAWQNKVNYGAINTAIDFMDVMDGETRFLKLGINHESPFQKIIDSVNQKDLQKTQKIIDKRN
jgi:DNA gyrase/topoisomerase IV subunit A